MIGIWARPDDRQVSTASTLLALSLLLSALEGTGCTSNHCSTNADCASDQQCVNSLCVSSGGADRCPGGELPCAAASDCISLQCAAGCCSPPCTANSECPLGDQCVNGACEAPMTGCSKDSDCPSTGTPICLTASKMCVQCISTANCGDPSKECSATNTCVYLPGRCAQSSDCASDGGNAPVCDTDAGMCVECVTNSDCPAGDVCGMEFQTCVPAPPLMCMTLADCNATDGGAPYCDTSQGICVGCVADGQCAAGKACRSDTCVTPTGCVSDTDCTSAALPYCQLQDGRCVQCVNSVQCQAPMACVSSACGACAANLDCTGSIAGSLCNADAGSCVQCLSPTDCSRKGAACTGGVCVGGVCSMDSDCANNPMGSYCDADAGSCVECHVTSECTTGLVCTNESCQMPTCHTDPNCVGVATGPHCDTTTMHCVECISNAQCSNGKTCQSNNCELLTCGSNTDCTVDTAAPYCDPGMLVCVECETNGECPTGQSCVAGSCGNAPTCTADNKCTSSQACAPLPTDNNTVWTDRCVAATTSGFALGGAACGANSDCRSGHCYFMPGETVDGICLDACQSPTDCDMTGVAQCPNNGVAITLPGTTNLAVTPACWSQACANDENCAFAGFGSGDVRVCGLTPNPSTLDGGQPDGVVQSCLPAIGIQTGGQICVANSDCESNYCVAWSPTTDGGHPGNRCFGACRVGVSSDCLGTARAPATCNPVPLALPGGTVTVNSCIVNP